MPLSLRNSEMKDFTIAHVNFAKGFRGGERQTELLISRLSELGVKQIIICRKESPLADHLNTVENLEIIELKKVVDFRLCGHLKLKKRADLIQAHETRAAQWAFVHHCFYGIPYVVTRRVPEAVRKNWFNRRLYGQSAAVVAISNSIAAYLRESFCRDIRLIPSSCAHFHVNQEFVSRLRKEYEGYFVVGHIGALVDKHKGQSTLIDAVRKVKDSIPNIKVLFLGDGLDREQLERKAFDLIEQGVVEFKGFVSNVGDYLQVMSVFAYPSNYEGLGSVLLDVMEQKVPIIASNVDGIPDIVKNNRTGILIRKGDSEDLARALIKINRSEMLREKLISGATRMVEAHSPEKMAKSYFDLYEEIIRIASS